MRQIGLVLALGLTLAPFAAAQPPTKIWRIGYLGPVSPSTGARLLESFRQGLRERGYVEGQNILIDYRWADGIPDRFPVLTAELIQLRVDVIVTYNNPAVAALRQATRTIPIVVANMGDPVGSGFVASLARPGGNVTGFSGLSEELSRKWVELLREAAPKGSRIAILTVSETPAADTQCRAIQGAANALPVTPQRDEIGGPTRSSTPSPVLSKAVPKCLSCCRTLLPMLVEPKSSSWRQNTGCRGCTQIASMWKPAA